MPVKRIIQILSMQVLTLTTTNNKRSFFRLDLPRPLSSTIKIIPMEQFEFDQDAVRRIAITNLSASGLRFISPVELPENVQFLLEFKFVMLGKEQKLLGQIVRKHEGNRHEYSVNLTIDDNEQSTLIQLINVLTVSIRRNKPIANCSFCTDEELAQYS
jgi:hypothetical protein